MMLGGMTSLLRTEGCVMKNTSYSEWFKHQRANFLSMARFVLLGLLAAGCSPAKTGKVIICGSNTIGEELAPRLIAEYKKDHPGAEFETEFKGTTYGFGALFVGRCDIAAASRDANTNETTLARDNKIQLNSETIGTYSVAVVVNAGSPIANLTSEQVRDMFTGAVQNWKEVGGPDAPVHLFIRHPVSGTHLGFRELAMENKPYALGVKTCTNYTDIVQAVAADPNAIGYSSIQLATKPGIKAVSIGGATPTIASVKQGKYPFARTLRFYTNKAVEAPAVREFANFVQSSRGQQILDEMGFVPVK
jgi:phosphate transport system substrate-binding protein